MPRIPVGASLLGLLVYSLRPAAGDLQRRGRKLSPAPAAPRFQATRRAVVMALWWLSEALPAGGRVADPPGGVPGAGDHGDHRDGSSVRAGDHLPVPGQDAAGAGCGALGPHRRAALVVGERGGRLARAARGRAADRDDIREHVGVEHGGDGDDAAHRDERGDAGGRRAGADAGPSGQSGLAFFRRGEESGRAGSDRNRRWARRR